ncbi:MAG: aminoacetone oxidase family FAD-binding enzyme [Bacteroidales bacterium]|nr:aminoacetone oxidase family FAD-binding enzyme [Bacteroidales bacterium]
MESLRRDLVIIGGGAAGLMAAAQISSILSEEGNSFNPSILLIEKMMRPGRKIGITGKGRCNLTNARMWDEFSVHVHPNQNFFKNAFYNFSSSDTMDFFRKLGLELTIERGQRVYPKSMKAQDVTDTLVRYIKRCKAVEISTEVSVVSVRAGESFMLTLSDGSVVESRMVLIATGGLSYPATGSTGDGYAFAEALGHTVTPRYPSLTALTPKEYKDNSDSPALAGWAKQLCGLQLKNVGLSLLINGNVAQEEFGDLDFTDGGIEGALGFRVSRKAVLSLSQGQKVSLVLDLKPSLSESQLKERIRRESSTGNNNIKYLLSKLLPRQMIQPFLTIHKNSLLMQSNSKSVEELPKLLKNTQFNIDSYVGYERCVVTNGGVSLSEISQKTMESKLQKGLYFAGEVIDLDGDTGGYNLQIAFSTASLAARSIVNEFKRES